MRDQRIPITGKTDASGNATIPLKLPLTGEWFDLKFPLSLSGPAEWAILAAGIPLTYGRGRRVTLGPELLQSGESVTITVTGGPPNADIIGSANGRSGDPSLILAGFSPSPNTIALDTTTQRPQLYPDGTAATAKGIGKPAFTVAGNGTQTPRFTLPPNATNIRVMVVGSTDFRFQIAGVQTGEGYQTSVEVGGSNFAGAFSPFRPLDVRVEPSQDTQVDITISDLSGAASNVFVSALLGAETTVIAGSDAQLPVFPLAAGVGSAPTRTGFQTLTTGNSFTVLAGVAGIELIYYEWVGMIDTTAVGAEWQIESSDGSVLLGYLAGQTARAVVNMPLSLPIKLSAGLGVRIRAVGSGSISFAGFAQIGT